MNNIFVSWKQKIESRIISDLKSQYTESEEQIRQRKEQFLKKQKKIILIEIIAGAVFLAFLIIRAAFLQDDILLSRNSFGQGSKEVQLSLKKDDKKKEITYKLDEQKLSAEEESKVYIQFFKKLKKIMMKNNTSLKQIQTPLNLPDTVDGYPFEITYELAEDGYIRLDGSINEEEQAKLKRGETYRTYIVVTARYGEYAVILEDIYEGDGQGYILRDMGSTNGTWLNGKKIKRGNQEQLEDGAVIRFAKKEYEFLIQDI